MTFASQFLPHPHPRLMTLLPTSSENCIRENSCQHMQSLAAPVPTPPAPSPVDVEAQSVLIARIHPLLVIRSPLTTSRILSQQFSSFSYSLSLVFLLLCQLLGLLTSMGWFHQHTNMLLLLPSLKTKQNTKTSSDSLPPSLSATTHLSPLPKSKNSFIFIYFFYS